MVDGEFFSDREINGRIKLLRESKSLTAYQRTLERLKKELADLGDKGPPEEIDKRGKEIKRISCILNVFRVPIVERLKAQPCFFVK